MPGDCVEEESSEKKVQQKKKLGKERTSRTLTKVQLI